MPSLSPALARAEAFCQAYNLRVPILQAPMAGACPSSLAIAVANAGGLGGCGALLMEPAAIAGWAAEMRAFQGRRETSTCPAMGARWRSRMWPAR